jgi:hypothetical protein
MIQDMQNTYLGNIPIVMQTWNGRKQSISIIFWLLDILDLSGKYFRIETKINGKNGVITHFFFWPLI